MKADKQMRILDGTAKDEADRDGAGGAHGCARIASASISPSTLVPFVVQDIVP